MEWTFLSEQEILEKMGGRVQAIRLERNITQKDIAEWSGASLTTVQRLEKGKYRTFCQDITGFGYVGKTGINVSGSIAKSSAFKKNEGEKKIPGTEKNEQK